MSWKEKRNKGSWVIGQGNCGLRLMACVPDAKMPTLKDSVAEAAIALRESEVLSLPFIQQRNHRM